MLYTLSEGIWQLFFAGKYVGRSISQATARCINRMIAGISMACCSQSFHQHHSAVFDGIPGFEAVEIQSRRQTGPVEDGGVFPGGHVLVRESSHPLAGERIHGKADFRGLGKRVFDGRRGIEGIGVVGVQYYNFQFIGVSCYRNSFVVRKFNQICPGNYPYIAFAISFNYCGLQIGIPVYIADCRIINPPVTIFTGNSFVGRNPHGAESINFNIVYNIAEKPVFRRILLPFFAVKSNNTEWIITIRY